MIYTKRLAFVFIVGFLVACAQMPIGKKDQVAEPEVKEDAADALDNAGDDLQIPPEETFVAIPKPELPAVSVPSQARDEFSLAKQDMLRKRWTDAEDKLLLMSETYPQLAGVYTNLGIVYEQQDKFDEAERAYRFAIKTNPLNFDASMNLGVLLRDRGKFTDAEQVYLAALKQWPHHQASLLNLGILYDLYMGKLRDALANYKLAQKLNEKEDRKLKGWIVDLERRLPEETAATAKGPEN